MNERTEEIEAELKEDRARLRDTVEELTERLSPGRLVDDVIGGLGAGPREFAAGLGAQLRDRPMPALLTGLGLAWLIMSERRSNGVRSNGNGSRAAFDGPTREELDAHAAWDDYQETSWALVRDPDEDDFSYEQRLTDSRARSLGVARRNDEDDTTFKQRLAQATEKTKKFAAMCRDKLKGAARATAHGVSDAKHAAESGVKAAAGAASATASRSVRFYDEHPLATGAIGLAIGAVVGSSLPLSRMEERRLKGLVDEGLSLGAEGLTGAAQAVETFADDIEATVAR